ncbi:HNH endonuclease [Glaciecola sp. 2405UD65-10]|uniref:HNH endonuclease n=1 Tax=Glaciecola sp. 2405UD65-10 TaxID=3397244 RepID=UPI003B59FFAD
MPSRPAKCCRVAKCKELVRDHSNQGYCLKHKDRAGWGNNERLKGNAHERGYDHNWRKLKALVHQRDKHLCQSCLAKGIAKTGTHCDHKIPKHQGGKDHPSNLQTLCSKCHGLKTAIENNNKNNYI